MKKITIKRIIYSCDWPKCESVLIFNSIYTPIESANWVNPQSPQLDEFHLCPNHSTKTIEQVESEMKHSKQMEALKTSLNKATKQAMTSLDSSKL